MQLCNVFSYCNVTANVVHAETTDPMSGKNKSITRTVNATWKCQHKYIHNAETKSEAVMKLCLLSQISKIWANIFPPYNLTAWICKSCSEISEALNIGLKRLYQQSLMEINCCKWSTSCEASRGQVWESNQITSQSAILHTVGAQKHTMLIYRWKWSTQELFCFFSLVSFNKHQELNEDSYL